LRVDSVIRGKPFWIMSARKLKGLMPADAKEASGHGVRAKRSKSGAISFDLFEAEASHAAVQ
jgi:hypothetical protein